MLHGKPALKKALVMLGALNAAVGVQAAPPLTWDPSAAYREAFPVDGVELGRGWYQNQGTAANGNCVNGTRGDLKATELAYAFTEVTSREQVYKALNINAAARYGVARASASFANQFTSDRSTITVMANVDVRKFGVYLAPAANSGRIELDKGAVAALNEAVKTKDDANRNDAKANALRAFFDKCGDSYVSAIENGASYNSQFSVAATNEIRTKLIGASVSGGFGRFKASISMSQEAIKTVIDDKVRVTATQSGGAFDAPTTAAEAYSRIKQFATSVTADNAMPFTIVLRPYESHADFPDAYQGMRTSPLTVSYLAGMVDRFGDLADAYRAALYGRYAYQFPLQAIDTTSPMCAGFAGSDAADRCLREELATAARNADAAALCLGRIVLWCRDDAICNVRRIPVNHEAATCLAETPLAALVNKSIAALPATEVAADAGQKQRLVARILDAFAKKSEGPANTIALNVDGIVGLYLQQLATLPLAAGIGADVGDIAAVSTTCALYAVASDCAVGGLASVPQGTSRMLAINQGLREWVFTERLGKVIGGACNVSIGHPLCEASDQALNVATSLKPLYTGPRRFPEAVATPVTPPAPTAPVAVKVVERTERTYGSNPRSARADYGGRE